MLEDRRLLATLGIDVRFLADDAGVPAAELQTPVLRGEAFWVDVRVQDVRSAAPAGVIALPLNLSWDPAAFALTSDDNLTPQGNPALPLNDPLVSGALPLQRAVDTYDAAAAAFDPDASGSLLDFFNLRGVRGASLPNNSVGQALGSGAAETFSRLRFVAIANADAAPFTVNLDGSMSFADADPLDDVVAVGNAADVAALANTVEATLSIVGGQIRGVKFDDLDGDGVRDAGEPGLAGVTIEATPVDPAGPSVTVQTAADGSYRFTDLAAGQYTVREVDGGGAIVTLPAGNRYNVQLSHATPTIAGLDFGNFTPGQLSASSLSGFVYADTDRDGVQDANEVGLPNWTIQLFQNGAATPLQTVTTAADGSYFFGDLPGGSYRVVQSQQPTFVDASITLGRVLPSGQSRGVTEGFNVFAGIELSGEETAVQYNFGENLAAINKRFFLSTTNPRRELCAASGGSCRSIAGTAGDDNILVQRTADDTVQVTVNDQTPVRIPASQADVVLVEGGGGQDNVTIVGSSETETFTADLASDAATSNPTATASRPAAATLTTARQKVGVFGAGQVEIRGGGGSDLGVLRDSSGADTLTANGRTAVLQSPAGDRIQMIDMQTLVAIASQDDRDDRAEVDAIDFVLRLGGTWV